MYFVMFINFELFQCIQFFTLNPKLNILEQSEIYKHHKTHKNDVLKDQINKNDHILYDITQYNPPI